MKEGRKRDRQRLAKRGGKGGDRQTDRLAGKQRDAGGGQGEQEERTRKQREADRNRERQDQFSHACKTKSFRHKTASLLPFFFFFFKSIVTIFCR